MSLLVICPTRGRPERAREMLESFYDTRASEDTDIVFVVHESDPSLVYYDLDATIVAYPEADTLTTKLNAAAAEFAADYDYLQFAADDMLYRTPGWDAAMTAALRERNGAFGYADSLSGIDLANHVVVDTRVVRALGWFALPTSQHLFLDNVWTTLGRATKTLYFFPDVVIEHMHPATGKAPADDSYRETNSQERYRADQIAFERWLAEGVERDAELVRKALS